ncbi:MAG: HD domain-containing protein [Candidatus Wildermuthbacteria bacterium]|nr:HD domain-containing protein [Candidatus Wildermuthbacteria bacterium]
MKHLFQFLRTIGELKDIQRKGILFYGVKQADSAADHTFRLALMVWILSQKKQLNLARALKLALVHDLCKVYTGDITPYDGLFSKQIKKNPYELAWRWRRLPLSAKQKRFKEKFQKEQKALHRLVSGLSQPLQKDIMDTWLDYQRFGSPEARFVSQLDRIENLLEAFETFEKDKKFPTQPWWEHADEAVHDKELLGLMEEISREELKISKKKSR